MSREEQVQFIEELVERYGNKATLADVLNSFEDINDIKLTVSIVYSENNTSDFKRLTIREMLRDLYKTFTYNTPLSELDDADDDETELIPFKSAISSEDYWEMLLGKILFGHSDGDRQIYVTEGINADPDLAYEQLDEYLQGLYVHKSMSLDKMFRFSDVA